MLTLDRLHIRQGTFALRADWSLGAGQICALIGPSGQGKSTLLSCLAGFLGAQSGQILWGGDRIDLLRPQNRPFAMIFQDHNLFGHLTAWQNVALGRHPGLRLSQSDRQDIEQALDRVGLAGLGTRLPAQLSGGQQGRVALARVLVQNRPVWLLDEPFAALGPALRAGMLALVRDMAQMKEATVLMVTHNPEDARLIADKLVFVDAGRAHTPRDTDACLRNPDPALAVYLGQ